MNDVLEWIARYPLYAFIIGCFVTAGLATVCDFLIKFVRSLTGKYPAARPVEQCDCDNEPCYCCRESGCQSGCRCFTGNEEEEEDLI